MPTTTSRRDARKARNREALIQAATALFRAHGYEATTIDQIAAAAGVSRRTFFRYFPTKAAVVFPYAEERLARFRALLEPEPREAPVETVLRACRAVAREFQEHKDQLVFQANLIESAPELQARERDLDHAWEDALADALSKTRHGRRRGAAAQRQAAIVAGAIMGALRAVVRAWYASGGSGDLEAMGEDAIALVARTLEGGIG